MGLTWDQWVSRTLPLPQNEANADHESYHQSRNDVGRVPWIFTSSPSEAQHEHRGSGQGE